MAKTSTEIKDLTANATDLFDFVVTADSNIKLTLNAAGLKNATNNVAKLAMLAATDVVIISGRKGQNFISVIAANPYGQIYTENVALLSVVTDNFVITTRYYKIEALNDNVNTLYLD